MYNGGSKAPIRLSRRGRSYLTFWARHCAEEDRFSPIQFSLSDNFSDTILRDWMFGLCMAPKEILSDEKYT